MKNIKIGTKIIVSFLFTTALALFMGIYLLRGIDELDDKTDQLYDLGSLPMGLLTETAMQVQELRISIWRWQSSDTDEERATNVKTLNDARNLANELINKQKEKVLNETGKTILYNLQSVIDKFMDEAQNYLKTAKIDHATGRVLSDVPPNLSQAARDMLKALQAAAERRIAVNKILSDEAGDLGRKLRGIATPILIAVLVLSLGLGVLLTISITSPMKTVVSTLSKIEKGDMTARAHLEREDELGILSKALDSLAARFQNIFKQLGNDSNMLATSAEELSSVGKQVSNTAAENASQSATVASTTEQTVASINAMASSAEEASMNANEVAGAAEQMSTNMNTIAAAIEQMSASISEIASNAGDASNIAHEATTRSHEATDVMGKLGTAAKEIGQVTDVIKKIADKTNLLALNATIEAASAGEAGKGFAVVAGEIKDLANQSAISADDIAQRINGIQAGTGKAIEVIKDVSDIIQKINHSVESISSHVGEQTKASNEIASNVAQASTGAKRVAAAIGEVAKGSRDIAHNSGEAARGAGVVSQNVAGITHSAKESAHGAEQINQSANELARLSSDLKNILGQFKV
ncbi:MAG: methyl-accepting chemotaxis protein [Fibromonadales bacterium]|nr:methyl-accepting chemotaxis protein [Fibromonadales bacterium]